MRYVAGAVFGIFDALLLVCVVAGVLTALYVAFKVWFGIDISVFYRAIFHFIYQQ